MTQSIFNTVRAGLVASIGACALLAGGSALAQGSSAGSTGIDASGNAKHEMAACKSGMSQQDKATCMREAENAKAARQAGTLKEGSEDYAANALKRCEALNGQNKVACQARVSGYGNSAGSVAGGGVIKQVETVVVPSDGTMVQVTPKTSNGDLVVIPSKQ